MDEALTLFSQRGYAATSVRDILRAAKVTQPTLYYHFTDKASLFQALIEKHYGESQRQLEAIVESKAELADRLYAYALTSFEFCCVDTRIPRLMFQTYFGPTVPEIDGVLDQLTDCRFRLVTRVMKKGIRNEEISPADPEFLALCFCCLIDQPINLFTRRTQPRRYLTPLLAQSLVGLFLKGAK
jgi:AcrR family transcriptional regulator